jgi:hypothetical protein
MLLHIEAGELKGKLQMQKPRAAFALDFLSDRSRSGWINPVDAQIKEASPSGGLSEKSPDDLNRCVKHRASAVIVDLRQAAG